jgi:hypothetical protein
MTFQGPLVLRGLTLGSFWTRCQAFLDPKIAPGVSVSMAYPTGAAFKFGGVADFLPTGFLTEDFPIYSSYLHDHHD